MNMLPRLKPRCFYDLVIEVDYNQVIGWIFAPTKDEEINNFEIAQQAQRNFYKKCDKIITKYPVEEQNVQSIAIPIEPKSMPEQPEIPETQSAQIVEQNEPELYIGRALLSEELPILMKYTLDDSRIYGFVRQ